MIFSCDKKIEEKNENDLNSSNQAQEEVKEKPKLKKFETFDEKKSQDILTQPREEVRFDLNICTHLLNLVDFLPPGVLAII